MEKWLTDQELLELVNLYPIAGGDGTEGKDGAEGEAGGEGDDGDKGGAGSEEGDEGEAGTGEGGEAGTGEGEGEGEGEAKTPATLTKGEDGVYRNAEGEIFLPKTRFDEESGKRQLLADELERYKAPPRKTTPEKVLSEDDRTFMADMERLYPGLKNLPQIEKQIMLSQAVEDSRIASTMETRCNDLLKEAGMEVTEQNREDLEAVLGSRITKDKKLATRFFKGDANVLNDVFKEVKPSLYSKVTETKRAGDKGAARIKGRLPTSVQKGAPGKPQPVKEVTLDTPGEQTKHLQDVHERAFERLQEEANRS